MLRIRELQAVAGCNLDEIREILQAGDRLESLRAEYRGGVSEERSVEIVRESARLNRRTQEQVLAKFGLLQAYLAELQGDAARYVAFAAEHGVDLTPDADG